MAKIDPNFPHDMFRFLSKELRGADTLGILERYVNGFQAVWEDYTEQIDLVGQLHNIDNVPDRFLPYLKHIVGWTAELDYITEDLSNDNLRKLIKLSAAFWKTKGTETGLKNAIRTLTGRNVMIWNWFYFRWTLQTSGIWRQGLEFGQDSWITGSQAGERDENLSFVWCSKSATAPRQLIRDIINLQRPVNEVVILNFAELVDDFRTGKSQWETVDGAAAWDKDAANLTLASGDYEDLALTEYPTLGDEVIWRNTVVFKDAGSLFQIVMRRTGDNSTGDWYSATFGPDGTVLLESCVSGSIVTSDTYDAGHEIPVDEWTVLGVDVIKETDGSITISPVLYGARLGSKTFTLSDVLPEGTWAIANPGTEDVEVDSLVAYSLPMDSIAISGRADAPDVPEALASAPMTFFSSDFDESLPPITPYATLLLGIQAELPTPVFLVVAGEGFTN